MRIKNLAFLFASLMVISSVQAKKNMPSVSDPAVIPRGELVSITPSGDVETVEQIQVRFSKSMIELGDDDSANIPLESPCLKNGNGYWTDEKNWVYSFDRAPSPGKSCVLATKSTLKSLDGTIIPVKKIEFKTLVAQVIARAPSDTIDPNQYFVLKTNGEVTEDWIKKNVYFSIEGLGDRIVPQIISGSEKSQVIQNSQDSQDTEYGFKKKSDETDPEFISVLRSGQNFPRNQSVILHWLKDFRYHVEPAFTVSFNCERESADQGCVPLSQMNLNFGGEIFGATAKSIYLVGKDQKKIFSQQKDVHDKSTHNSVVFKGPFEANSEYTVVMSNVKSINGEPLANQNMFPLKIRTAALPSLLKIEREFSVLEASHPILPITIRNIEDPVPSQTIKQAFPLSGSQAVLKAQDLAQIFAYYKDLRSERPDQSLNVANKKPFEMKIKKTLSKEKTEVVGVPLVGKGFHLLELKSRILGGKFNMPEEIRKGHPDCFVRGAALVTNLNMTMKSSPHEVLVWVTSLEQGQPLAQVKVQLYSHSAKLVKEAVTDARGLAYFQLSENEYKSLLESRPQKYDRGFFAVAQKQDDFSFIHSEEDSGVSKYRFGISLPYKDPENIYHAILEKSLLRPKETLKAKLIYRHLESVGLSIPKLTLPKEIQITNRMNQKRFMVPVKWDVTTGTGVITWKVSEEVTLGSYEISYPRKEDKNENPSDEDAEGYSTTGFYRSSNDEPVFGHFSIREFKTPTIISSLRALESPWVKTDRHQVEFSANYFSGGPAAGLPIEINYSLAGEGFHLSDENYQNFSWLQGGVTEGLIRLDRRQEEQNQPKQNQLQMKLDKFGRALIDLKDMKYSLMPQRAVVQVNYKDSNGDIQSITRGYPLLLSPWALGLKPKSWFMSGEAFDFEAALLDIKHKPIAQHEVTFTLYQQENYSTRKKLLGGFYAYESFQETKKVKDICKVKTNAEGKASCHYSDKKLNGRYLILAQAKDEKGTLLSTNIESYVYGEDNWIGSENSDRMDLIPLKRSYEPGEEAEFQVRGPISEGKMLVTVERGHILSQQVVDFKASQPIVKIKIQEDWAPNIVVSAILLRGRVPGKVSGMLDLGKPSLKMGMTSIRVGLRRHILNVKVKTNKEAYEPRQNIETEITVTDASGKPVNGEVAVAAVDEALLALSPNTTWDLLGALVPLRSHQFETSYLISQVLGKRTLGLKAVPLGGDGAGAAQRELFDTSLFWDPKVKVVNGSAKVAFKANDSLTAFKVVAVAMSGADKFGTAETTLRIYKDIQSFSALALAVRKGDSYPARFNVRNSTKNAVALKAKLKFNDKVMDIKELKIDAGVTEEVQWPVTAPDSGLNKYELIVTDAQDKVVDAMMVKQPVHDVWPMRALGSSLQQGDKVNIPVKKVANSTQAVVQATALPSLAQEIPGIKKFWDLYPFECFEQKFSRAISLNSTKMFNDLMKVAETYLDKEGFIKFFPMSRYGSVYLTNYVLQASYYQGWKLDKKFQESALKALRGFFDGTLKGNDFYYGANRDLIRLQTLDSLTMYNQSSGSMFETVKVRLEMLTTHDLTHAISILNHDKTIPNQAILLQQALQILRSRSVLSSGRLVFKETLGANADWMYVSEDITFAKALMQALPQPLFQADGGRLILSFMEHMTNGAWKGTMENAWGILALRKYKDQFEKTAVKGQVTWGLASQKATAAGTASAAQKLENKLVMAQWPLMNSDQFEAQFVGQGLPWWNVMVLADVSLTQDVNHGLGVEKMWKPITVKDQNKKSVGDIWEVTLKIKSKSSFQWLAVRDPLPPGSSVIEENGVEISEKKAIEYRIFESWFNDEKVFSYKVRFNQSGQYHLPSTRGEAMYNPDVYGEKLNGDFVIAP